jgi:acetylornithine deacetylase/succinyl-diaminopimelate desuccinylase-like protein
MAEGLRHAVEGLMGRAREDLAQLVSFASVHDPAQFPPEECEKAARWTAAALTDLGFEDVTASETDDGSKAVHGVAPGPPGTPTVLLYCHHDVQPPLGEDDWASPVWTLTERGGRWYGRGAADCKGNAIAHLTALRALREVNGGYPCTIKLVSEGSEEQGTGGLERFVEANPDVLRADAICVVDAGNAAAGLPTLTTTLRGMTSVDIRLDALKSAMHSGMFGGSAPDPVAGLIALLATLHDERGNTTVDGLASDGAWSGLDYAADQFRSDAGVLDGVDLIGDGTPAEMLWARPSATVLGMDIPPVAGSVNAVQAGARARIGLRIPPGVAARDAQDLLVAHLERHVPWNLRATIERGALGEPWTGRFDGPAYEAIKLAMSEAFGRAMTTQGVGGSIPLCNTLATVYPDAEILLYGVEEPTCLIHAPNESVDPAEIERIALAEALFLERYAGAAGAGS